MSEFMVCKDAVDFIKEIRLNNLYDWKFSQKLLEIEGMIKSYYESEDYSVCDSCSYSGNDFDQSDIDEAKEDGYEEGMEETLEAVKDYVEKRLKHL